MEKANRFGDIANDLLKGLESALDSVDKELKDLPNDMSEKDQKELYEGMEKGGFDKELMKIVDGVKDIQEKLKR